tara:strand:- start:232 stop:780 length:549 start_codon:yes stop_codon:yes gene_type:complete
MAIAIYSGLNSGFQNLTKYFNHSDLIFIDGHDALPANSDSLILLDDIKSKNDIIFLIDAIRLDKKILGVGKGIIPIINYFAKTDLKQKKFNGSDSTFIALGSKFAEIIGGAGPLKTHYKVDWEVPIKFIPNNFLISAFNTGNGCIEALESMNSSQILGVIWPIFNSIKHPSGFQNILSWVYE